MWEAEDQDVSDPIGDVATPQFIVVCEFADFLLRDTLLRELLGEQAREAQLDNQWDLPAPRDFDASTFSRGIHETIGQLAVLGYLEPGEPEILDDALTARDRWERGERISVSRAGLNVEGLVRVVVAIQQRRLRMWNVDEEPGDE